MQSGVFAIARTERGSFLRVSFMLILLTGIALASRPIMPIDETRYIGVAWEMWLRGDFLVPFKNGVPYSHKPPLMMWLIHAGWAVFGVNDWWPRLVSPLVSAGNVFLTLGLAHRLWPNRAEIGNKGIVILVSCLLWTAFSTMVMFDILLVFFTLVGMHGMLLAAEGKGGRGFCLLGAAIGLGVLSKGPVILLHVLPVALLARWWNPGLRSSRWLAGLLAAVLIGVAIALSWAIPAGITGGEAYRRAIFWGQTADRMVESFAHRHSAWWYLPHLPLMFLPWFVWPGLWRALINFARRGLDRGGRFCLAWMLPVIVIFSCISGKQMQYLLPIFPAFALLAARAIDDEEKVAGIWLPALAALSAGGALLVLSWMHFPINRAGDTLKILPGVLLILVACAVYLAGRSAAKPVASLASLGIAVSVLAQFAIFPPLYSAYDVRPLAQAIRTVQDSGRSLAHDGTYHNQYQFAGRLRAPLLEIESTETLKSWLAEHPQGYAVVYASDLGQFAQFKSVATQRYRGGAVALLDAPTAALFFTTNATK